MKKIFLLLLTVSGAVPAMAQSKANPALQKIASAMGTSHMQNIRYSGSGTSGVFGQNHSPHADWPIRIVKSYTRTIDYANWSFSEESVRTYENPPAKGGGAPFLKEQTQTSGVSGMPATLDNLDDRHLQLLVTPHGFLKQALATPAATTVIKVKGGSQRVSYKVGKYSLDGDVNKQGLIERVRTWTPNPVLGDMVIETIYSNYKDYKGARIPYHIVQNIGGHLFLDLTLSGAETNLSGIVPPTFPSTQTIPVEKVEATLMSDGVWFLAGGTHNSLLVEFKDYVVVLDAPLHEARSVAVIDEIKKLVPGKPIRYVVNSHHHFDHSGGLRTYVAEGAIIVTSDLNPTFYQEAWKQPRTLTPDRLSLQPKNPNFIAVTDHYVLTDSTRTLTLYHNSGSNHNAGMLFGYLPKEKILFIVDEYSQGRLVDGKLLPVAKGFAENLYLNLDRLDLDIETVAPGHGSIVSFSEMASDIGH